MSGINRHHFGYSTKPSLLSNIWMASNRENLTILLSQPCQKDLNIQVNMAINLTRVIIGHTDLMKSDIYYNIYCIGINTIFASLFPFIALMFLNVRIALELRSKKVK